MIGELRVALFRVIRYNSVCLTEDWDVAGHWASLVINSERLNFKISR